VRDLTKAAAPAPVLLAPADGAWLDYPSQPLVLSWQPVGAMKSYTVQIDDVDTFASPTSYSTVGTSLAVPALQPTKTTLYWRVQGVGVAPSVVTAWSSIADLRSFKLRWPQTASPLLLTPADLATIDDVVFTWTPVPGAAKYRVEVASDSGFLNMYQTKEVSGNEYVPLSTYASQAYYWRVLALDAGGSMGPWSDVRTFTKEWQDADGSRSRPTPVVADADPTTPGAQLPLDQVVVSWAPVSRATNYVVQFSKTSSFNENLTYPQCTTPHTTLTIQWTVPLPAHVPAFGLGDYPGSTGVTPCISLAGLFASQGATPFALTPWTTYYVRVRAYDTTTAGGTINSAWSNESRFVGDPLPDTLSFTVIPAQTGVSSAVQPAVLVSPADGAVSADNPVLRWAPVSDAVGYLVALALDDGFTNRVVSPATNPYFATNQTSFVVPDILLDNTAGHSYYWYVLPCTDSGCAVDNLAINQIGKFRSFRKLSDPVTGLEPASLATVQADTVDLSWQDQVVTSPSAPGLTSYDVRVLDSSDTQVDLVRTDETTYSPITTSYPDGPYKWQVRAIDASGTALGWSTAGAFTKTSSVPVPLPVSAFGVLPVLQWQATAHAASYDVEVYADVDPAFPALKRVLVASSVAYPAFTPTTNLPPGTYSWRVRQVDRSGVKGLWSTTIAGPAPQGEVVPSFVVTLPAPALLSPADATDVPATDLVMRWGTVAGAVQYRVEVSTADSFATSFDAQTSIAGAYAPIKSYVGGTTYWWRAKTLDAAGTVMAVSTARSFRVQTVPLVPTDIALAAAAASPNKPGTSSLAASWAAPTSDGGSPVTGYLVGWTDGVTQATPLKVVASVNALTLDGLLANTTYQVSVAAVNALGVGPWSTARSAKAPGPPSVPTSLGITKASQGVSLQVGWLRPADNGLAITHYVVSYASVVNGVEGSRTDLRVDVPATSTVLTGLTAATVYRVWVKAVNGIGPGPEAMSLDVTTYEVAAAPAIKVVLGALSATASWTPATFTGSSGINGYQVSWRRFLPATSTYGPATTQVVGAIVRSQVIKGLVLGGQYDITVQTSTAIGLGVPATRRIVAANVPGRPSALRATSRAGKVKLTWKDGPANYAAVTSHRVWVSTNGSSYTVRSGSTGSKYPTYAWGSTRGKTIWVKVATINAVGVSAASAPLKFKVG
jgi:hypothetical protein